MGNTSPRPRRRETSRATAALAQAYTFPTSIRQEDHKKKESRERERAQQGEETPNICTEMAQQDEETPDVLMDEPWRRGIVDWDESTVNSLKDTVSAKHPVPLRGVSIPYFRLLLVGQVGAGKSSFFNSVNSTIQGHLTTQAAPGEAAYSITTTFRVYEVRKRPDSDPVPWRICDTMGLQKDGGLRTNELLYLVDGNIPDRFKLSGTITPDDAQFRKNPTLADKAHCVAFVIDASTIDYMKEEVWNKLKEFQTALNDRAVPVAVLLTKIDQVCSHVDSDLKTVFRSQKVHDILMDLGKRLQGLPPNKIFPVKNYEKETELEAPVSILVLKALNHLLNFSQDFLNEKMVPPPPSYLQQAAGIFNYWPGRGSSTGSQGSSA